jgi:hypothetical protein
MELTAHLHLMPRLKCKVLYFSSPMIGEGDCGAVGGMKISRETEVLGEKPPQHHFVHHKSHLTLSTDYTENCFKYKLWVLPIGLFVLCCASAFLRTWNEVRFELRVK